MNGYILFEKCGTLCMHKTWCYILNTFGSRNICRMEAWHLRDNWDSGTSIVGPQSSHNKSQKTNQCTGRAVYAQIQYTACQTVRQSNLWMIAATIAYYIAVIALCISQCTMEHKSYRTQRLALYENHSLLLRHLTNQQHCCSDRLSVWLTGWLAGCLLDKVVKIFKNGLSVCILAML